MMKFEDFLMQPSDDKQKRLLLEEEVEELREELDGHLQLKTVLQCALQGPVRSCPCLSSLPPRVQELLEELVVAEEEIIWLERKVDVLKMKLYREKKMAERWEMLQLKQVQQHQQQEKLLPPRPLQLKEVEAPTRSQNYHQLRKQYRIRKERRASVGSCVDFHTISSPIFTEEIPESSRSGSRSRRHHSQPDIEMESEKPNKLSEDLIKCLISIYLKLNKASLESKGSSAIAKQSLISSKKSKSLLCKTSLNCTTAAASEPTFSFNDYASNLDPYGILLDTDGTHRDNIGAYKNFIQVSRSSLNTSHISECLLEMGKLRNMVHKLSSVDLTCLTYKQKLAFWINVYNVCIMHAFLQHGLPSTEEEQLSLVNKAAINVGGIVLNALAIEHFILRHPRDTEQGLTDDKERVLRNAYGLGYPEPNVTFSLCRGSWSSPALRIYTPDEVVNELERAKVEYLEASVGVTSKKKIVVPKLMQWHMKDFADDMESLVEWIYSQLPNSCSLKRSVMDCLSGEKKSPLAKTIEVQPYTSEFRYLLPL